MGIHATAQHALLYGALAATVFSGALGFYRRGLATGLILGICAGAATLVVVNLVQAPLATQLRIGDQPHATSNIMASAGTADDNYDRTSRACALGILTGCAFSGIVGSYRCGLVTGTFLAICTGATLLVATISLWLPLLGITTSLT